MTQYRKSLFILPLIFFALIVQLQEADGQVYFPEDMIKVAGRLIDKQTNQPVPYANVLNQRIRGGTMTDAEGKFSLQADPTDTLTFKSLGYLDRRVPVSEITADGENAIILFAPVRYQIGEVVVKGSLNTVDLGFGNVKTNTTPAELRGTFSKPPPVLAAVVSPTSYLYYKLSKREKEKRSTLALIQSQRQWEIFSLVYNKEVVERVTGFKGQQLDDFMVYFNAFSGLNAGSSNYDVEKRIRELMIEFLKK